MDRSAFVWDEYFWRTTVRLPAGGWTSADARTDRSPVPEPVSLYYAPEGRDDHPLNESEIASVAWTVANLPRLMDSLLPGLFAYYQAICADPDGLDPDYLPALDQAEELKSLIGIESIYVHQISKDGKPYVGFEATCLWDEEHGLGALMHDTRIVKVGGGDTAVLLWIAEEDSEGTDEVDAATRL
ncbi:hypothetical protein PV343_13475 [Streptomyces sp. WI03-4A]|uniref:DUF6985 domain-containing protein n=1 Tax=Streptomyces sp. WI03-4A TaxID=3028706 RepID=UPI0029AA4C11|nr:hypothetical protein [Streptomyces sp. WI03-4A]MDX2593239.1 hypothetical protein [Streptomyces sp. WI03-4A]